MPDPLNRKPWPMKWVVLAIIACVIPYTWITLAYRKPNPAYQPYEDSKQRANVLRLLEAGYRRIYVPALAADAAQNPPGEPTSSSAPAASISAAEPGLTPELASTLVEPLPLPRAFTAVSAAAEIPAKQAYSVAFTCRPGEHEHPLSGAHVFIKNDTIVIVPAFEPPIGAAPRARQSEESAVIHVPAGALHHPQVTLILIGAEDSRQWSVSVR